MSSVAEKHSHRLGLPQLNTAVLYGKSPFPFFLGYPDNFEVEYMSMGNNIQTGIHRLLYQNKRRRTSHNFSCGLDICSSKHVLLVS